MRSANMGLECFSTTIFTALARKIRLALQRSSLVAVSMLNSAL